MKRFLFYPRALLNSVLQRYPAYACLPQVIVSIQQQYLYVFRNFHRISAFPVSTSRYGQGCTPHSLRTPLGLHCVYQKVGGYMPRLTRFVGRIAQDVATLNALPTVSHKDAICTRILWLSHLPHSNISGKCLDSKQRYIYIHGTIDEKRIGRPASAGCIRMRNDDVCVLFSLLSENSLVRIIP